jgi:hypothetical protein
LGKVLLGGLGTFFLAAFGADALFYRESFSIGTSQFLGGGGVLFRVEGNTAVVMGVAWLSAALAVFVWFVLRPAFPRARGIRAIRDCAIFVGATAFLYVAFRTTWMLFFGGQP